MGRVLGLSPYGSWPSPITSDVLVEDVVSLSQVEVADGTVWWNERRPAEGGRQVVVAARPGEEPADVLPAGFSARTRVHEYGGGGYAVHGDTLFFTHADDQRLYRLDPGSPPRPITPEPPSPHAHRYADADVSPDGSWLVCVRERHEAEVINDLVKVPTTAFRPRRPVAGGGQGEGEPVALAGGHDFYAAPRLSPDGRRLAWLTWDHPRMPWDGTDLWVADVGPGATLGGARHVAGGPDESISQPRWAPDGTLHFVSDRSGWWNLYADDGGTGRPLVPMDAEFSGPDWVFGQSTYAFLADGRLVAAYLSEGTCRLGVVDGDGGGVQPVATTFTAIGSLKPWGRSVVAIAASPRQEPAVVAIDLDAGSHTVLRRSRERPLPSAAISEPRAISFPSAGGRTAHAFFYPPSLDGWQAPAGELPPLLVISHGGPTGATSPRLDASVQFWTSRGLAVVDVDYGGSTGYGREYRRLLDGQWGVVDVDDCVHAARFLADQGLVDADRLLVRGGSAGGFTTLCILAFRSGFAAGASYYGVADLESLAADTHKFESRYLDRLVGPYPAARDLYRARSPVHAADRLRAPVIVFQGLEDRVVPPAQAEVLVDGLRANRVPFAYLTFEGEQHGFRKAETIKRAIEAELWFYGRVVGFEPVGVDGVQATPAIEGVTIENADRLGPGGHGRP